jgi:hypothetical protein
LARAFQPELIISKQRRRQLERIDLAVRPVGRFALANWADSGVPPLARSFKAAVRARSRAAPSSVAAA